jgi:hypothetical protein
MATTPNASGTRRAPAARRERIGPHRSPVTRRREEGAGASSLNLVGGIWLIVSPWILGFADDDPIWSDVAFGGAIALLAFLRIAGAYRESWLSWLNALLGAWVFVTGFWIYDTAAGGWNSVIAGAIVILLGVWSAAASEGQPVTPRAQVPPEDRL